VKTALAIGTFVFALGIGVAAADPKPAPKPPAESAEQSRFEVAAPVGHPFKRVAIDNALGDVRVEGYEGTAIRIETFKHAPDADTLDRLRVTLVPNPDGSVRIATTVDAAREARPMPRSAVRIDLIVRAPHNAKLEAAVGSGKLEVLNMEAGSDLDTASGPIMVKHVQGEVFTHSVSGTTQLSDVVGSVDAQTISSDVDLDTIHGERLVASANHGHIAGRRVRASDVELTTIDGRITLEAETALRGHLVVASLHGDVDVRLHRHGGVVIRARATKVDLGTAVVIHQADRWLQATYGDPNAPNDPTAAVELRSQTGVVQFAIIE
jgi:hypothetical protein